MQHGVAWWIKSPFVSKCSGELQVESAIGARRIRSISKSGMCSLTTFLDGFFRFDDGFEQPVESAIVDQILDRPQHIDAFDSCSNPSSE